VTETKNVKFWFTTLQRVYSARTESTHACSGKVGAVVFVAGTSNRVVDRRRRNQLVGTRSTDAMTARCLARLPQRQRAADAAIPRVNAVDKLDRRRFDETVQLSVDCQTGQFHAGQYQRAHQGGQDDHVALTAL